MQSKAKLTFSQVKIKLVFMDSAKPAQASFTQSPEVLNPIALTT